MRLKPGETLHNYEILRQLGEGGMGEVWLAREIHLDREVAIKCLNPRLTSDPEFAARFLREARIQAKLTHTNIVALYNYFTQDETHYMVLEYARGITLRELISRTGPIPEKRALHIFEQMAEALGHAHAEGIIHRDVKPSNVMVDVERRDAVKVLDFGIARMLGGDYLTRTGTKMGTIFYMSPEQVLAQQDIDLRSDIYSAGVVLYEMLSGRLPFSADTDSDFVVQTKIVNEPLADPRDYYPHISQGIVDLVNWMTAKDRNERPQSFKVILGDEGPDFPDFVEQEEYPERAATEEDEEPDPHSTKQGCSIATFIFILLGLILMVLFYGRLL